MNNVQRCLCHFYTWMRHSKQTATLLLTKHHANFDTSTSAKGYARVCTNCACAIVVLGILLAQARPTMPCIHLVIVWLSCEVYIHSLCVQFEFAGPSKEQSAQIKIGQFNDCGRLR